MKLTKDQIKELLNNINSSVLYKGEESGSKKGKVLRWIIEGEDKLPDEYVFKSKSII